MRRTSRDIKVGIFVATAMAILIGFLTILGGLRIWQPSKVYHIRFEESVAGLDKGSPVRIKGVKVGTVQRLHIPGDDITTVEVTISVDKATPIRQNTEATIGTVGITGLRYIDLMPGSADAPDLPPGSTITGTESFLASISGTAESAIIKAEVLIDNLLEITSEDNRERIENVLHDVSTLLQENSGAVSELLVETRELAASMKQTSDEIHVMLEENKEEFALAIENLNEISESAQPMLAYLGDERTIREIDELIRNSRELSLRLNTLVGDNQYAVDQTLADLREISRNLSEFSQSIRARPSLLLRGAAVGPRALEE